MNTSTTDRPVRVANNSIGSGRSDNSKLVADRIAWQGSNYRGGPRWTGDVGRLPRDHWDSFYSCDYAVWSYLTPIAWHIPGTGWVMPDVRYSPSTGRQQSQLRMAFHWEGITPEVTS